MYEVMTLRVHDVQSLSEERLGVRKRNAALLDSRVSKLGETTSWAEVKREDAEGAVPAIWVAQYLPLSSFEHVAVVNGITVKRTS